MPLCYASILPYVVRVYHYTEQLGCSQLFLLSVEPQSTGLLRTFGLEQRENELSRHLEAVVASGNRTKGKCLYRKSIRGIQSLNNSDFLDLLHSALDYRVLSRSKNGRWGNTDIWTLKPTFSSASTKIGGGGSSRWLEEFYSPVVLEFPVGTTTSSAYTLKLPSW